MIKRLFLTISIVILIGSGAMEAQTFALKTDVLGWATASFNVEPEVRIGKKSTIALGVSYNPWTLNRENMKWKHILVQPEYRFWFCSAFQGHFLGAHPAYMHYNVGGIKNNLTSEFARNLNDYRYQGDLFSIGLGYGYHWIITNHLSMEAEIGLGAAWTSADYYYCERCGEYIGNKKGWFFTPTKLSVSFIYVIK